jgi:nucleoid-associated protein YgaU
MQRDVKVGLVLGVLLVAVVAVVFFRRDDDDRGKFAKLLPAPDAVADRARDMLGPSQSDPYPVAPEFVADSWQSPKSKSARTPTPPRNKNGDLTAQIDGVESSGTRKDSSVAAVLQPPEIDQQRTGSRSRSEPMSAHARASYADGSARLGSGTEYTIQEGDTLSDIARRRLGSAALWRQIYEENQSELSDPEHIPAGKTIRIPTKQERTTADRGVSPSTLAASTTAPTRIARANARGDSTNSSPAPAAGNYVVKQGDTLTQIAKRHYDSEGMYLEILRANSPPLVNPADIHPGMVLRLP